MAGLDDILYEVNSNYMKKESAKNFDMMDMVYVIGDERTKPWSYKARKVNSLFNIISFLY